VNRVHLVATVFLCAAAAAPASNAIGARLDSCVQYYESGEYLKAIDSLNPIFPVLSSEQEQRAYRCLALSYAMLQMTARAQLVFDAALERYPSLRIDSLEVPPRIWTVFEETRLARETSAVRKARVRKNVQISMASVILAASAVGLWGGGYLTGSAGDDDPATRWGGVAAAGVSAITGAVSIAILAKATRPPGTRRAGK